nr:MAG: polyprotein [Comovirus sp.]
MKKDIQWCVYGGMFASGWNCCGCYFPGGLDEVGQFFGCNAYARHLRENKYHLPGRGPGDWIAFVTPQAPSCKRLGVFSTGALLEEHNNCIVGVGKVHFPNADDVVEGEDYLPSGVVIPSFELTPTVATRDMATEVLGDASCRLPVETRLGVFKAPKRNDAFKEAWRWGVLPSTILKTASSTLISRDVAEHPVQLVAPNSVEIVDERISVVARSRRASTNPETVHVGPIAVSLVNYGSRESDLCQAGVFMDSRHANTDNSVLGAYVCRVNNEEQALLFFPGSKLPLNPRINEVLKVRFGISNLDVEGPYQLFQSTAIAQTWSNVQGNKPTLLTQRGEQDEHLMAQRFKRNHCQVVNTFNDRYKPLDTQVNLGRSLSLRQISSGDFQVLEAPRRSVLIRGATANLPSVGADVNLHQNFANALAADMDYPAALVDPQDDANNLIHSVTVDVELAATHGTSLSTITLANLLLTGNGKARQKLAMCGSTNCCIRVEIEGGQGPLVGGAICGAFAEGTITWEGGMSQVFNLDHFIMNPFSEDLVKYHFRPVPHMAYWSPLQLDAIPASFAIFFVGPYTNPPKTTVTLAVRFYVAKCGELNRREARCPEYIERVPGFLLAEISLPQGKKQQCRKMPLFLGNPQMSKGFRSYCQGSAVLSQYAAIAGEVTLDIFVYSSTLIKGYVHVSLIASTLIGSVDTDFLERLPSVKAALVPGHNLVKFPVGNVAGLCPTMGPNLQWSDDMVSSLVCAIWSVGSISGNVDGDFSALVIVKEVTIEERVGHGMMHVQKVQANATPWTAPDWWHNIFTYNFVNPLSKALEQDLDLYTMVQSVLVTPEKGNTYQRAVPSAMNIIGTSTFAKADIEVKISWWKRADFKIADCVHIISASTFPDGLAAMAGDHLMSSEPTGSFVFGYKLSGPFDGFRFVGNAFNIAGQSGTPCLRLTVDGPKSCRMVAVSVKVRNLLFTGPSNGWVLASTSAKDNIALE